MEWRGVSVSVGLRESLWSGGGSLSLSEGLRGSLWSGGGLCLCPWD